MRMTLDPGLFVAQEAVRQVEELEARLDATINLDDRGRLFEAFAGALMAGVQRGIAEVVAHDEERGISPRFVEVNFDVQIGGAR